MKRILMMAVMAAQAMVFAADKQMSLAEARPQIDSIIEGKTSIESVFKQLSADDQKTFLREVNSAVCAMPASVEEKVAKQLNLNQAAITSAKGTDNVPALLAETFATVSPDALTVINEQFAKNLLNRDADPNVKMTDEQYTKMAVDLMKVINERTAETDNGSARSTFAILALVRASNGSPTNLVDTLVATLPDEDARELAKTEWIPEALGLEGRELGYEPLLASVDAGRRPDFGFVLRIAGPQHIESILTDIVGKNSDLSAFIRTRSPVLDAVQNTLERQLPGLGDGSVGFGGDVVMPETRPEPQPEPQPQPRPQPEPQPYQWQG